MNRNQVSEASGKISPRIDAQQEGNYLKFVQKNISCREKELEDQRESIGRAAANNQSLHSLRNFYDTAKIPDTDNPYFIRIDLSDGTTRYYGHIRLRHCSPEQIPDSHSGVQDNLILSSRADGKGYTADYPENLPDLIARTRFQIANGKILKISEEFLNESFEKNKVIASDVVTESVQQTRKREMQPISSTLQPDQFKITRESAGYSLAIQGPPGSGKTAVLLERLARIAFADEAVSQKGMLLVGPNRPFMEYVSKVLPALGENNIALKSIDEISEFSSQITDNVLESEDLIFLKGSHELKTVLENLVKSAPKITAKTYFLTIENINLEFSPSDALEILVYLENEDFSTYRQLRNVGENKVMNLLVERFQSEWNDTWGDRRRLQNDPAVLIAQESTYRTIVRNMFPLLESKSLLDRMKADAAFFVEISQELIDYEDQLIWLRESELLAKKITPLDVPILDYLEKLLGDSVQKWGHIAIDETQDLNTLQLEMLARRIDANGTFSLAGDLAQATGQHYYPDWEGVLQYLQRAEDITVRHLTRSYRVPSEILEYAQQFLRESRISVSASEPFMSVPNSLNFVESVNLKDALDKVASITNNSLNVAQSVLIVASKDDRKELEKMQFPHSANAFVRILEPTLVKGLEFDAVIILNPGRIIEDYAWTKSRLARLFYVLSTRSTKNLYLIGTDRAMLENPLIDLEDDEEVIEEETNETIFAETIRTEQPAVALEKGTVKRELLQTTEDATSFTNQPRVNKLVEQKSIESLCRQLNVPIEQMSDECMTGQWIFAGATQIKCNECADKPQLIFLKHPHNEDRYLDGEHIYAFGCTNCSTIRIRKHESLPENSALDEELQIVALLDRDCLGCEIDR